jgi:endonuclease/exonuclease/phosphatase (EEP) superfamily protein YafD
MDAIRAATLILAIATAIGAALCLGGAVSDRLDVFTHLAPLYLAAGVIMLIVALATRSSGAGDAAVICAASAVVIFALLVAPELIARASQRLVAPAAQTVKLVQFNVWDRNIDAVGTARWILAEDPDIVVVEEADDAGARIPALLQGRYPHFSGCEGTRACPTMILSKVGPSAEGRLHSPGLLSRWGGAWASFGQGAGAFTVIGVHYTWPVPPDIQQTQSRRLGAFLARFDRQSLIVAGDFNMTPWSFSLWRQDARFGLQRRTRAVFTWPAAAISHFHIRFPFAFLPIDHVYAGKAWRTVGVRRGPRLGSDHFPVVVVLTR